MSMIPQDVPTGAIRYNTDSNKMECFNGTKWMQVSVSSPGLSAGTTEPGTRGVFAGSGPSAADTMDWITISTLGDATDFANNDTSINYSRQGSSRIRGFIGNDVAGSSAVSTYVFAIQSDATDFGDLTQSCQSGCFVSNATRLCSFEGTNPSTNVISYVTMATTGTFKDFGDMSEAVRHIDGFGSPTRGVVPGGWKANPGDNWTGIQYITIPTTGNAVDFGEVSFERGSIRGYAASSNSIRGLWGGGIGGNSGGVQNQIEWVNIASKGNGQAFGDLTYSNRQEGGGCASATRAIFAGGYTPSATNVINFVNMATEGDAADFGDLSIARACGGASNGHGGL